MEMLVNGRKFQLCKINSFWKSNTQHDDKSKKQTTTTKNDDCKMTDMLASLTVGIIL